MHSSGDSLGELEWNFPYAFIENMKKGKTKTCTRTKAIPILHPTKPPNFLVP
jgi:hypothetical protein